MRRGLIGAVMLLAVPAAGGFSLSVISESPLSLEGASAITWADDRFYVVRDHDETGQAMLHALTVSYDSVNGRVSKRLGPGVALQGNHDSEGVAFDAASGTVWVSDENGPSILEFTLMGRPTGRAAPIPERVVSRQRPGRSLESLALSPDGLTLWTANEQALVDDGDATDGRTDVRPLVRLMKFTRPVPEAAWRPAGEWAYRGSPCAGAFNAECGISDLCALDDGSLLVLEREVSTTTWGRCQIYRVTPEALAEATDVSLVDKLAEADVKVVDRGPCLLERRGVGLSSMVVYEGLGHGPRDSATGAETLFLVADGGSTLTRFGLTAVTVPRFLILRLER